MRAKSPKCLSAVYICDVRWISCGSLDLICLRCHRWDLSCLRCRSQLLDFCCNFIVQFLNKINKYKQMNKIINKSLIKFIFLFQNYPCHNILFYQRMFELMNEILNQAILHNEQFFSPDNHLVVRMFPDKDHEAASLHAHSGSKILQNIEIKFNNLKIYINLNLIKYTQVIWVLYYILGKIWLWKLKNSKTKLSNLNY